MTEKIPDKLATDLAELVFRILDQEDPAPILESAFRKVHKRGCYVEHRRVGVLKFYNLTIHTLRDKRMNLLAVGEVFQEEVR